MAIDKQELYGQFDSSHQRRRRLTEMATRKALDLPLDDDMNIITNRQGASMPATALLSTALLLGGGGLGLGTAGLFGMFQQENPAPSPAPGTATAPLREEPIETSGPTPETREYKVTFWADDQTEIRVESPGDGANDNDR